MLRADPPPPARILLVEDEFLIALSVEDMLQEAGLDVVGIAATYEDAVELAGRLRPDLVLMDVRLASQRDGIDAAIEIRRRFDIPSLFASANSGPVNMDRALPARPLGWLTKPYTCVRLVAAITAALGPAGGPAPS